MEHFESKGAHGTAVLYKAIIVGKHFSIQASSFEHQLTYLIAKSSSNEQLPNYLRSVATQGVAQLNKIVPRPFCG
jgi:hypothetical protein